MTTPRMNDESFAEGMVPKERRRSPRAKVDEIVYMNFQSGNGGIILDVSSQGMGFQAADRVEAAESLSFRLSPRAIEHIEIIGQVVWLDATRKRGGLRLTHVPVEVRSEIQRWQGQHLPLPDVERAAEVKTNSVLQSAIPESPSEAAPVGGGRVPSFQVQERTPNAPSQAVTPGAAQAPAASVLGRGEVRNAFVSAPWSPHTYSWEEDAILSSEESRRRRRNITISLIVALSLIAAGLLYFGDRRWTGELLMHWGESLSGEQSKASGPVRSSPGTTETEAPVTTPLPTTAGTEPTSGSVAPSADASAGQLVPSTGEHRLGNADEASSSVDASGPNGDSTAFSSDKRPSPTPAEPESIPEAAKRNGVTPPRGDNGEVELAQARKYLAGSAREDSAVAAQLLWVAVGKGNGQAELELADLYLRGEGSVRKNCQQARILLTAAENNHSPEARERLAHLRDYGCR